MYATITINPQKDRVCALAATRKREMGSTRVSAADSFDLQQVSNGVHGCVQVGTNGPDLSMKINDAYYHEVLLT